MEGRITVIIDEDSLEYELSKKYEIAIGIKSDYEIKMLSSIDEDYNKIISNYKELRNCINEDYNDIQLIASDLKEYVEILKSFKNREDSFYKEKIDSIEYIQIYSKNNEDTLKYLEKNQILRNKKIILEGFFDLDTNIDELELLFKNYHNIYVEIEDNNLPIKLNELKKTQDIINNIVNDIKKYNYSPIEQIMYAYDIVRSRVYTKETENELAETSRDLTKVLLGDKIVCVGYARVLKTILNQLRIKNLLYELNRKNSDKGHALNLIYIDDKKYNIKGLYYFDPTWDSKKIDNDNYLYSYRYFANTKERIENYQNHTYKDKTLPFMNENIVEIFKKIVNTKGINNIPKDLLNTINTISKLVDNKTLINSLSLLSPSIKVPEYLKKELDIEKTIDKLEYYKELFYKPISADILLKVLYNVRKLEYYNNPSIYPFDIDTLYSIVINSNWNFNTTKEERLLEVIFGNDVKRDIVKKNTIKYIKDNDLELKIQQIKLTKTLRNIYEKINISEKYSFFLYNFK